MVHQDGRPEIDWTTENIVISKFESPAKVEYELVYSNLTFNKSSHNAIASILISYRTFLEPLFTGTHLTRRPC